MKWTNRLGVTAVAVAVAAALTTGAAMATPAPASSASATGTAPASRLNPALPVSDTLTITAHKVATPGEAPAAGPPSITCYASAYAPVGVVQNSYWYGVLAPITSVGGVGFANCTYPVALIEVESALYWQGLLEADGGTYTYPNRISGTAPSIAGCVPGDWQTETNLLVIWPPGYGNSTGRAQAISGPTTFDDFDCS